MIYRSGFLTFDCYLDEKAKKLPLGRRLDRPRRGAEEGLQEAEAECCESLSSIC